jgi:hypothetical protein
MSVSKHIMHFRDSRASELELIARLLNKNFKSSINTYPIYNAIKQLRNPDYIPTLKDGSANPECWGYEIEDFIFPVEALKHIRPDGIKNIEIILNMKLIANCKEWESLSDPLCDLNFNVIVRGVGEQTNYSGFHIDRHFDGAVSTEPHPIYHLQYSSNPFNEIGFDYGRTLWLDTPRIMHYPMDFILGIGFLTSNFSPSIFYNLLDDGTFTNLYKQYQERIWKPFSHSLADHWPFTKGDVVWKPTSTLCPYLI